MEFNFETDIQSLSDFRANIAHFVEEVNKTKRPIVLTKQGKSAAILLDVTYFQEMIEKLDRYAFLMRIQQSIKDFEDGKGLTQEEFEKKIDKHLESLEHGD